MDGVNILNTVQNTIWDTAFPVLLIFGIIVCVVFALFAITDEYLTPLIGVLVGLLMIGGFIYASAKYVPYNTYQVTINETVNFTDFTNKYEIIGQEGLIYTVKEIN